MPRLSVLQLHHTALLFYTRLKMHPSFLQHAPQSSCSVFRSAAGSLAWKALSCKHCFIYSGVTLNLSVFSGRVRFAPRVAQVERSARNRSGLRARASLLMWADCAKSTIVLGFRWAYAFARIILKQPGKQATHLLSSQSSHFLLRKPLCLRELRAFAETSCQPRLIHKRYYNWLRELSISAPMCVA